ncbi:helix-turn-helix domain-containing protein [Paenibacillus sp. J5C2022]|uniref:helix-turn-helix domain-containing protein n=1 Tax=Paenibacillus sp. J5C2022 TaxID=2977129 RepID=UPI0021D12144|nr:helix-turn-helix domain-containing protein [Paenibacillus sp. J5C2022]
MLSSLDFLMHHTMPKDSYVDFHHHSCFEIVYYVRGTGEMVIERDSYRYGPGTISITRPKLYHDERHDEETEVIFIGFLHDDKPAQLTNGICHDQNGTVLPLMQRMKREMGTPGAFHAEQMNLLTGQVVMELLRLQHQPSAETVSSKLHYAIRALEENYLQSVDFHSLSDLTGYSYDRFRHLFKEQTGQSPLSFVIGKRLEHAVQLLLGTDDTISAIAQDCGFSTASQFGDMFKRQYQLSPSQYRRLSRGTL